uniref:Uncharacterized protein n=1 Tax=Ciona intestinalis TaxID=7719 RepID=F6RZI9_CIOIN
MKKSLILVLFVIGLLVLAETSEATHWTVTRYWNQKLANLLAGKEVASAKDVMLMAESLQEK